eukprot:TRINITY_DN20270_c0_g1_i1.p1 TRINITY_DN20270_c0_g1~~TRINITY_DN20270_c0_g1_i1.p1  ORF type:complete len:168 (+),score=8.59 TRINITY_DN20270_c0_g1_i1:219-722(+)
MKRSSQHEPTNEPDLKVAKQEPLAAIREMQAQRKQLKDDIEKCHQRLLKQEREYLEQPSAYGSALTGYDLHPEKPASGAVGILKCRLTMSDWHCGQRLRKGLADLATRAAARKMHSTQPNARQSHDLQQRQRGSRLAHESPHMACVTNASVQPTLVPLQTSRHTACM